MEKKKKVRSIKELMRIKKYRIKMCEKSLFLFFAYYFSHYLKNKSADFHKQLSKLMQFDDVFCILLVIAFRESAKTAWAKAMVTWWIVYRKKRNVAWGGIDNKKSEKNVMAIANELQINKKIVNDFGQLYFEPTGTQKKKRTTKKTMSAFITENDVYVQAFSPAVSPRGENYKEFRPDGYVLDDIENVKTAGSARVTKTIIAWLEEIFGGTGVDCDILFITNRVSNRAVVAWLEKKAKGNSDFKIFEIDGEKPDGSPAWSGKFKKTIKEAIEANKLIDDPKKHFKSLEKIKRTLGTALYNQEMRNRPRQDGDALIKEHWIKYFEKARLKRGKKTGSIFYHFPGHEKPTKGRIMIGIDPAVSQKETADERAIAVIAKFIEREKDGELPAEIYYFVLRVYAGRWSLDGFARELLKAKETYPPVKIGCESNGVQQVFRQIFQKYRLSTVAINPKGDKIMRMSEHEADFEFGYVCFPDDGSEQKTIEELIDFTGEEGKPDNRVDSIEMSLRMHKRLSGVFVSTVGGN